VSGRDPRRDPEVVKKMAQLMMQGAVMLQETCPLDGLPLFRLRTGEVVCPVHGRVVMVSSEEEAREVEVDSVVRSIEHYAAVKARESMEKGDPQAILDWLKVIESVERIRGLREARGKPAGEEAGKRGEPRKK